MLLDEGGETDQEFAEPCLGSDALQGRHPDPECSHVPDGVVHVMKDAGGTQVVGSFAERKNHEEQRCAGKEDFYLHAQK